MSETNRTLSLALDPSQGVGWREFGGPGWIQPESIVGTFEVYTDEDQPILCITEARTGKTYRLATRNGPAGSGIVRRFVDKYGAYGGIEIPWTIRFREHTAPEEHELIKHLLSQFNFRNQLEDNKGASGYDAAGYRTAQEISLTVYKDGDVVRATITRKIPLKGSIVFDQQITANRIQLELSGTASELRITEQRTDYEVLAQRVKPDDRLMSHHDYQAEFSKPLFRVSRGKNPLLNRATGVTVTGSVFGYTKGPDLVTGSAMVFSAASVISAPVVDLTGNLSVMAFLTSIPASVEICRVGTLVIRVENIAGTYFASINDNGTIHLQGLSWTGTGWVSIMISRDGDEWYVYENGVKLITFIAAGITAFSGDFQVLAGNPKHVFDLWLLNSAISDEACAYYYENVISESGKAVLPIV